MESMFGGLFKANSIETSLLAAEGHIAVPYVHSAYLTSKKSGNSGSIAVL